MRTVQLHGEQVPVLRRGTPVVIFRTTSGVPAGTTGTITDLRLHGRGVQYLVSSERTSDPVWVGGRHVRRVPKKRRVRRANQEATT